MKKASPYNQTEKKIEIPKMSESQLRDFEMIQLAPFLEQAETKQKVPGVKYNCLTQKKEALFLENKKAIKITNRKMLDDKLVFSNTYYFSILPLAYQEWSDKIAQWRAWVWRKVEGEMARLKQQDESYPQLN